MNDKNKCLHTRTNVHTNARSRERTFATQEKGRTISPTPERALKEFPPDALSILTTDKYYNVHLIRNKKAGRENAGRRE